MSNGKTSGRTRPSSSDGSSARGKARKEPPVWRQDDGAPVSCLEKIKVLNENYAELHQMAQDALEDALLIGCSESQVRAALHGLVEALVNPYPGRYGAPTSDSPPPTLRPESRPSKRRK